MRGDEVKDPDRVCKGCQSIARERSESAQSWGTDGKRKKIEEVGIRDKEE